MTATTLPARPGPAGEGWRASEGLPVSFALTDADVATEPPEARGLRRDHVRLLVSRGDQAPEHTMFTHLDELLEPGDLLVVNTSATVAAAVDASLPGGRSIVVHVSTELPGGLWMVEPRAPDPTGASVPLTLPAEPTTGELPDGTRIELLRPAPGSTRLWLAVVDGDLAGALAGHGRPIRYKYVPQAWPLEAYGTVFGAHPGSAEMPSASRPFTPELVTRLVRRGVALAPIVLHTGVSSLEGHELPYPERFEVPPATAALIEATRGAGGHVIAVGTTVVRALESVAEADGRVHAGRGWTDVVITPERGAPSVDGLVTGWHEPEASHLAMLEAVAGRGVLVDAYEAAHAAGYRWHEFGDSHLLLPYGEP